MLRSTHWQFRKILSRSTVWYTQDENVIVFLLFSEAEILILALK